MQASPEIINNIHNVCAYKFSHVKQSMLNMMTCAMLSNYFVIGSLSNPKEKSNHVWKYVKSIVCHVKCVNGLC